MLRGERLHIGSAQTRLSPNGGVYIFGAGKAAPAMALALERGLGRRVCGGVVITKTGYRAPLKRVQTVVGSHPHPAIRSIRATRQLSEALRQVRREDCVLFVWSGGASALLFQPRRGITATQKIQTVSALMDAGADIRELNTVRKHLSAVKGGQLLRWVSAASVISLVLSDVCGDNPATVGSGPTVPDCTTFDEAIEVMKRYGTWETSPRQVRALLQAGKAGKIPENPTGGNALFRNKKARMVGSSADALDAAAEAARRLGYRTFVLARQLQGDAAAAAHLYAAVAAMVKEEGPYCLLSAGETTVRLEPGHGCGGRSQHFTLALALLLGMRREMDGKRYVVLSAGTDGTDGPTDAAGAMADKQTLRRARQAGLNPEESLCRQDSYPFFRRLGDLVMTGPTNTNVMDLRLMLVTS